VPHSALEALVEGEETFSLDDLANDTNEAGIVGG
jgi:hypothetical protein